MGVRSSTVATLVLGSCLAGACVRAPSGDRSAVPARPNVLLITIDTLRADRIGTGIAPTLDRLAAAGVRFTAARSAVPLTLPSHTTIMTGLWPPMHGVRENGVDRLTDGHATIARLLRDGGYRTAAFVGAFVLDHRFGLSQGFEMYDDEIPRDPNAPERLEAERPAAAVVDRALAWLDSNGTVVPSTLALQHPAPQHPAPFFVWIHLYDPHAPYNPPLEFLEQVRHVAAAAHDSPDALRYDGEIAYADSQVGRVLSWLRSHALVNRTLVVVAGDHGEGLTEHGERSHGMLLYDSTLRVPLMLSAPGHAAATRNDAVSLLDVAPTILHAAQVDTPAGMTGRDLLAITPSTDASAAARSRARAPAAADVYAETEYPRNAGWSPLQALIDGRWKTIRHGSGVEVYDLQLDPGELHDIASSEQSIAAAMTTRIDALRAPGSGATVAAGTISAETAERLRALGYVAGGSGQRVDSGAPNPATEMTVWTAFEEALNAVNLHRPDAQAMLKTLAAAHPDSPLFRMTYARALREAGDAAGALAVDRAAAKRWPADASLMHDLGVAARDAAQRAHGAAAASLLDEAARAEQAALVVAPDSATSHNGLGLIAADAGRPGDAAKEFDRAVALDATNVSYRVNLGNARRALHDASGAEEAYRRALALDAHAADAANGLGVLRVEAGRDADAVQWFERAIASAPGFVEARLNLGIALQQSGQPVRAAEAYRQVLAAPAQYDRERAAAAKLIASLRLKR